jgi:hypothetical protein
MENGKPKRKKAARKKRRGSMIVESITNVCCAVVEFAQDQERWTECSERIRTKIAGFIMPDKKRR